MRQDSQRQLHKKEKHNRVGFVTLKGYSGRNWCRFYHSIFLVKNTTLWHLPCKPVCQHVSNNS